MSDENLNPIGFFLEELKNGELERKLKAIEKISTVALALGCDSTRSDLLPVLEQLVDDEDELLLKLAVQLADFCPLVGGVEQIHCVFPLLEKLAQIEESVVRDQAVDTLRILFGKMNRHATEIHCVPMIKRLGSDEWFTPRISAVGLIPPTVLRVGDHIKPDLVTKFVVLGKDDSPLVRSAVASRLKEMIEVTDASTTTTKLHPLILLLIEDDSELVRSGLVPALVAMAAKIEPNNIDAKVLPLMHLSLNDHSWRVRMAATGCLIDLQKTCKKISVDDKLVNLYADSLHDPETEVRLAALKSLKDFLAGIDSSKRLKHINQSILPVLKELAIGGDFRIRQAVATGVCQICTYLGKEKTMEHVLPMSLLLLKDDKEDVSVAVIKGLSSIIDVVGIKNLTTTLIRPIVEMSSDPKWRVRESVLGHVPLLASKLGVEYINEALDALCFKPLVDPVHAIRELATQNVKSLGDQFGTPWVMEKVLPRLGSLGKEEDYRSRMTFIYTLKGLAEVCTQDYNAKIIVPLIVALNVDKVPNVRFNVARTLGSIGSRVPSATIVSTIKPVLEKLKDDEDEDVSELSVLSLEELNRRLNR